MCLLAVAAVPALAEDRVPLRVGAEVDFQPFSDVDPAGEATGFAVELFAAAARAADIPFAIRPDKWDTLWQGVVEGRVDALPLVARMPEREGLAEFTRPHTFGYDSFFVHRGRNPIESLEQARKLSIMVMRSDAAHHVLASRGFKHQLFFVDTLADGLRLLASGQHDALLAPVLQGNMLVQSLGLTEAVAGGPQLKEYRREYSFAVRKGDVELRDRLERGLLLVKRNGEYDRLYRKWLRTHEPATFPRAQVLWGAAGVAAVLAILSLWTWSLGRQVRLRTAELSEVYGTLQASFQEIDDLYQHAPCGYHSLAEDGTIVRINDTGLELLGCPRAEVVGRRRIQDFLAPPYLAAFEENFARLKAAGQIRDLELEYVRKDGSVVPVMVNASVVRDAEGRFVMSRTTVYDMTERKQVEARLQMAASVFTYSRDGVTITDEAGNIIDVNSAFTRITGYTREEVVGRNPRILNSGRHMREFYQAMWQALRENGYWSGEIWNRRKNGEVYAEMITISAVRDGAGRVLHYVALFTDITALKDQQQRLEHIAHYDPLTSLPNRVLLADRLQQAIGRCQRTGGLVAVAYLDLDSFKAINDQYGHKMGDELLIAVAQRMKAALREVDTIARLGGDEFVAVLVDLEEAPDCEPLLERLLQAASDPVTVGDILLRVTASVGATLYPYDGADADQLLRHADQAMYQAKEAGKNRYHLFDVVQEKASKVQRETLEGIRRGLAGNEFVLHYQPKVNMRTGELVGAEALIRWQHPERGLLYPGSFLPVVENDPLCVDLGEWVIASALGQIAAWRRQGLELPVSVNIAARQLQEADFLARLERRLAASPETPPSLLELEVLESSALEDIARVSEVMEACRKLGIRFALDDFGTGYSSLTYLKRLPAEVLKIDQSFVRDILEDQEDRAIVAGVVGLARAFQREVIAEGVETAAHGELLLALGCELAQGYGIARPMPADDLPAWLAAWRRNAAWEEFRATA